MKKSEVKKTEIDPCICSICNKKNKCWELESGDILYEKGSWETIDFRMINIGFDFCNGAPEMHCSIGYFFDLDKEILEEVYWKKYCSLFFCSEECLIIGYRKLMKELIKVSDKKENS